MFKHRFESDDKNEKAEFLQSLKFDWVEVGNDEKRELGDGLRRCLWGREDGFGQETFFKVSRAILVWFGHDLARVLEAVVDEWERESNCVPRGWIESY